VDNSNLPILLFSGGTHGNFIARCLSIASGVQQKYNLWGSHQGAHTANYIPVVQPLHHYETDKTDVFAFICLDEKDLYPAILHLYRAGGDLGLDLLDDKDLRTRMYAAATSKPDITVGWQNNLQYFEDTDDALREFLKLTIAHMSQHFLDIQTNVLNFRQISHFINFADLHDYQSFEKCIQKLVEGLGYTVVCNLQDIWQTFYTRNEHVLASQQRVFDAFNSYVEKRQQDVSQLTLFEQAYIDYLREKYTGKPAAVTYIHGYPKSTLQIGYLD